MREAYNDPPSLKQILKDAPTEANLRKVLRGFDTPNEQSDLRGNYERPKAIQVKSGATAVLEKTFAPLSSFVTIEDAPEPMAP